MISLNRLLLTLPCSSLHAAQRLPLDQYPNLKRWLVNGVEKLPCWQKTQGAVDKALLPGAVA
jgi:hypothetical protein